MAQIPSSNQLLFGARKSVKDPKPDFDRISKFILNQELTPSQAVLAAHMDPWVAKLCQEKFSLKTGQDLGYYTEIKFDLVLSEPKISYTKSHPHFGPSPWSVFCDAEGEGYVDFGRFYANEERALNAVSDMIVALESKIKTNIKTGKLRITKAELELLEETSNKIQKGYKIPQDELIYAVDQLAQYW